MTKISSNAPKLTIGMATYDDFDGVYFSIQAVRMYHPEILDNCEFLVVDNHPGSATSDLIQSLARDVPLRYVPFDELAGTAAVKDIVVREARGKFVLCMDSHILFPPGALRRLLEYFDYHSDTGDLLQGPLLSDGLDHLLTHWELKWFNGGMGMWASDARGKTIDSEPFEIPAQGMGVFACRRAAWPGYNPRFEGFATEEVYIHEKFRRAGGKCLCLPFLRWVHRFGRPGVPYRYTDLDRFRNFLIAHQELGWDFRPAQMHWSDLIGTERAARLTKAVKAVSRNPFYFFEGVFCIRNAKAGRPWEETVDRLRNCRVRSPIRRIDSLAPEACVNVRLALSHREIIARAQSRQWKSVVALDEEIALDNVAVEKLNESINGLRDKTWSVLLLDGSHFQSGQKMSAFAYHESVFSRLLTELPGDEPGMRAWLEKHESLPQYLSTLPTHNDRTNNSREQLLGPAAVSTFHR
jgi:hypothetical protein